MPDTVGEVATKIVVNLTVNGVPVPLELDRENAEKLVAKLQEALGQPKATYVPYPVTVPCIPYTPPHWWGPVWTSAGSSTSRVKLLTTGTTSLDQLPDGSSISYTATVD